MKKKSQKFKMSIQEGQNIFNILCQENGYLNIRREL